MKKETSSTLMRRIEEMIIKQPKIQLLISSLRGWILANQNGKTLIEKHSQTSNTDKTEKIRKGHVTHMTPTTRPAFFSAIPGNFKKCKTPPDSPSGKTRSQIHKAGLPEAGCSFAASRRLTMSRT